MELSIHIINISILLVIVALAVWVFVDSMKKDHRIVNSLGWSLFALFFFPPVGVIIYFIKTKRTTTRQNDAGNNRGAG